MMNLSKREISCLCKLLFSFFRIDQPQILNLLKKSRPYLRSDPLVFLNLVSFSLKNYNFKHQSEDSKLLQFYFSLIKSNLKSGRPRIVAKTLNILFMVLAFIPSNIYIQSNSILPGNKLYNYSKLFTKLPL